MIICVCFGFTTFKVAQNITVENYIHSESCQLDSYLQLDCFDACNGYQVNSASQQNRNVPNESNILNAFDALMTEPISILCSSFSVCKLSIILAYKCSNPFFLVLFKPPSLG